MTLINFDTRCLKSPEEISVTLRAVILNNINAELVLLHNFLNDFIKILDLETVNYHPKFRQEILEKTKSIAKDLDELGEKYLKKVDLATDLALIQTLLTTTILAIEVTTTRIAKLVEDELGKLGGVKGEGYEQR